MNYRDAWRSDWIDCNRVAGIVGCPPRVTELQGAGRLRYVKTDFVHQSDNLKRLADAGPCVLISHASDASVTTDMVATLPQNVVRWFACHVETMHPKAEVVPVGFIYSSDVVGWIVAQALAGRRESCGLLYMNHTREHPNYHGCRDGIWERFEGKSWVFKQPARLPFPQFFAELAAFDFVLSPPGCGPDCHRHWEAMALGTIPVVLRSVCTQPLEDMPALIVDSWKEVTEERLVAALPELRARFDSPAMQKMTLTYWRERIFSCIPA